MNKAELIKEFSTKTGLSVKEAGEKLQVLNDILLDTLADGNEVTLIDLGKIKIADVAERECLKNPRNKEEGKKVVPAHKKAKYSASAKVKEAVKKL